MSNGSNDLSEHVSIKPKWEGVKQFWRYCHKISILSGFRYVSPKTAFCYLFVKYGNYRVATQSFKPSASKYVNTCWNKSFVHAGSGYVLRTCSVYSIFLKVHCTVNTFLCKQLIFLKKLRCSCYTSLILYRGH